METPKIVYNPETSHYEIKGEVTDPELAETALKIGLIHRTNQSPFDVIAELEKDLPEGIMIISGISMKNQQDGILIGSVRVRRSDPPIELYLVRKGQRGRPTFYTKPLKSFNLWLPEEMIYWLKSQPGSASEVIRKLIAEKMNS